MCFPSSVSSSADNLDYSKKYNTQLSAEDEAKFAQWTKNNQFGRDLSKDVYDYDLRGYYQDIAKNASLENQSAGAHLPDTYKKPNHPTFSDQSKYSTGDTIGGKWSELDNGKWQFTPSKTTLKLWGKEKLKQYWQRAEPGNILDIKE